jgi:protein SCO1/2
MRQVQNVHRQKFAAALLLLLFCSNTAPAQAVLLSKDIAEVKASPLPGARLPLDVSLDDGARSASLGERLEGKPSVWVVADFTCQSLCSPLLRTMSDELDKIGLVPGQDFNIRVLGLDPKDSAADAATMKAEQIGTSGALAAHTQMLRGSAADIGKITAALGFNAIYDPSLDQYAHPAAFFTVTADGRVSHALEGLGIASGDLRLAIVEAGGGRIGSIADHVRLLCYGFDPRHGMYNLAIGRALSLCGGVTIALLAGFLGLMFRRERQLRGCVRGSDQAAMREKE